jgi:superfamily II DNA or RNA helicase
VPTSCPAQKEENILKITIDSVLRLQDVPAEALAEIKAELTIRNPDFDKKRRMGLNKWVWGPEYIKLYSEKTVNGSAEYILPRGYFARLWNLAGLNWGMVDDKRVRLTDIEFPAKPNLRDYQSPAVKLAKDWQQGVLVAPCGSGKTCCGMGMIAEVKQPTLWITHTMDLLSQSMESAKKFLGLTEGQIGIIQGDKSSIGSHITFATVQTLSKRDLTDIRMKFGCIIVDECHLVVKDDKKFRMFADVIAQFPAYYRFGLTASEFRSDGLISTMFHVMGPKFYEVDQDDPRLSVMKPKVEFIETEFIYDQGLDEDGEKEMLSVQQMYQAMREDGLRDIIVLKTILGHKDNDSTMVLGHSLEHLERLLEYVSEYFGIKYKYGFINGSTSKKEREKILSELRKGKYNFLFATYQLAKLGLDVPRLNRLILATPVKDRTSIQQAVGRVMRPEECKQQPVVYDIWDSRIPQCRNWARERVKVYRDLGADVVGGPKVMKKKEGVSA